MKVCLQCEKQFDEKRETAKFCSDNCRVKWNRKNGKKDGVTKVQMQVLYNSLLEAVEKMSLPQVRFVEPKSVETFSGIENLTNKHQFTTTYTIPEKTFQQFMNKIPELQYEDEFKQFVAEIEAATKLSDKQKNLLLINMRQSKL